MARIIANQLTNAVATWLLSAVLLLLAVWTAVAGSILWTGFTLASLAVVLVPVAVTSDPTVMPDATVVAVLTVPLVLRAVGSFRAVFVYVVLTALALVVAVEIDSFSTATFTPWFAATFVVFVTMAVAGLWGIAQYASDAYLGTSYLTTRTDLMWELVLATGVGIGAGLVFGITVLARSNEEPQAVSAG